jgi:hypothetical protein
MPQLRHNHVMPIGEDVGADVDRFPHRAFDREPPAVNRWLHALDDHAARTVNCRLTTVDWRLTDD